MGNKEQAMMQEKWEARQNCVRPEGVNFAKGFLPPDNYRIGVNLSDLRSKSAPAGGRQISV